MAYIKKSKSKRLLQLFSILLAITICIIAVYALNNGFFKAGSVNKANDNTLREYDVYKSDINIVRAISAIEPGEIADITRFEIITIPESLMPEGAVVSMQQLKDKRIRNKLYGKQFVLETDLIASSAWYDNDDRLIEHSFQPGTIPASAIVGSIIDIKLFRQNAEDALVISKAVIVNKQENTLSLYLNAVEQEYLKEAASEGVLFITQYLDGGQQASDITYRTDFGEQRYNNGKN